MGRSLQAEHDSLRAQVVPHIDLEQELERAEVEREEARASAAVWRQRAAEAKAKRQLSTLPMSELRKCSAGFVERRVAELEGALARERSLRTGSAASTNLEYLKN